MIAAGCDLSTRNLDLCVIDTDTMHAEHRRIPLADKDGQWWHTAGTLWQRLNWAGLDDPSALDWLRHHHVTLLGIERPYGPSRGSIASLHTILGALLATLAIDAPWLTTLEIRPAEMRRELGLKSTASKQEMHDQIRDRHAPTTTPSAGALWTWPPDALDAYAVAWAAYKICDRAAEKGAAA